MIVALIDKIKNILDVESDADKLSAKAQIQSDTYLSGPNIFYLFCSALLASVGLDISSPAVIIGAMLISPLMSPILGIGLSLGIHDKEYFFISIRVYIFSVLLSLFVSTIYFILTPLGNPTTEILSRIKPTALDILIAFFGGIAGIVAVTRSKIAAALPGVAIATALMPPICAAGFGLATLNSDYFFGAVYLFFINTVFISFAAYLIVRHLKFPFKEYTDRKRLIRTKLIIGIFVILAAIPSFFIFMGVIKDVKLNKNLDKFIKEIVQSNNTNVIEWKYISQKDNKNILSIYVVGKKYSLNEQDSLNQLLSNYGIENTKINLTQLSDENGIEYVKGELKTDFLSAIKIMQKSNDEKEKSIKEENLKNDSLNLVNISKDLRVFFPDIKEIGFTNSYIKENIKNDTLSLKHHPILTVQWKTKMRNSELEIAKQKIYEFVKDKLQSDTLSFINLK